MQEIKPPTPKQYRLQQLADFLNLYNHLIGELPKELVVEKPFLDWYKTEVGKTVKSLGGELKDDSKVIYGDVELKVS